ncbi:DUF3298 domain-containing protein [Lachnospiraceae bacterium WCA-693-APC-MOT-I]|uniref:DUF3298 domain-containing protein n=2 Tax=Velocimicrobium porci TaxID=2606634 RepID=A0A6L5XWX2_9FIRM|nr:DUF3298 domain-containing protein [Velocimicrobium porci]
MVIIMRKSTLIKWVTGFAAAAVVLASATGLTQSTVLAKESSQGIGAIKVEAEKTYEKTTKTKEAKIVVPKIKTEKKSVGAEQINKEMKAYTDGLIKDFKKNLKNEGHESVTVSYKVLTNNKEMFTLRLETIQTMASSSVTYKFYHLDKKTGKVMNLKSLFKKNADYINVISKEIKKQMREQMKDGKVYFLDTKDKEMQKYDFKTIKKNQNFYIDKKGNLVICFDKYEVAPGSEGCPQFTIAKTTLAKVLK